MLKALGTSSDLNRLNFVHNLLDHYFQASPLHLCCQWGLEEVVQTLLEHGAAINAKVRQDY
jgi:ankyrin repeat protein